jgi:DNA-binding XRE family transcriptional regulator
MRQLEGHLGERPAKAAIQAVMARSLIRRRTEAGLEQKQLAKLAGVRAETISRIESGRYRPQRETMERLERALAGLAKATR